MLPFRENGIEQQRDEIVVGTTGPVLSCSKKTLKTRKHSVEDYVYSLGIIMLPSGEWWETQ